MNMFKEPLRFLRFQKVKLTPEVLWKGFRAQIRDATTWPDKAADVLTAWFGTVGFLAGNALLFAGWLLWNTGYLGFAPFDPFPFIFLTMIVSLEAIFLSVIVLITQNRQSKIADLRQKMDFEIDVRAELHRHAGLADRDEELEHMIQKTDLRKIEEEIRNRPG